MNWVEIFIEKVRAIPDIEVAVIASGCAIIQGPKGMAIVPIPKRSLTRGEWSHLIHSAVKGFEGSRFLGCCKDIEYLAKPSDLKPWEG